METKNRWLNTHKGTIDKIVRQCTVYDAKGSYGGNIPLKWIIKLLTESTHEIFRLQTQIDFAQKPAAEKVKPKVEEVLEKDKV
jgi:hypothetical protein